MAEVKEYKQLNGLALAYMGDAVYENLSVNIYLLLERQNRINCTKRRQNSFLQRASCGAKSYDCGRLLTEEEDRIAKRGRNAKSYTVPKNTDPGTYSMSTSLKRC